jgi:hypothetical protein
MKKHTGILLALLALSSASFADVWVSMTKPEVENAFVNKTWSSFGIFRVNGRTIANNTFIGHFDNQGHFYGKFIHPIKKGPQTDQGSYQIQDTGKICMKFQHWDEAKEFCTHVYQTKDAYIIVGTENILHTVVLKQDVKSANALE